MHGHDWNVSCFLPCKSFMVCHGRRTPYFKYSVDKDLKMEDSHSAPLMVKWEDFCSSVCCIFFPFIFADKLKKSKSGPFSLNICKHKCVKKSVDSCSATGVLKVHVWSGYTKRWWVDHCGRWKDIKIQQSALGPKGDTQAPWGEGEEVGIITV